jgi:transposase
MKKRVYRATRIGQVNFAALSKTVSNRRIVFGVDVAKEDFFGVFMNEEQVILQVIKWKSPRDFDQLLGLLTSLPVSSIAVAMESSGTYGDALAYHLKEVGIPVHLVSAKMSKDACEVYDGVPSSHDAKSAAIIAKLHWDGRSGPWPEKTDGERELAAQVSLVTLYSKQLRQNLNRLEAKLARHWPELPYILNLDAASTLGFLQEFGGPAGVAREPERALKVIRKIGGSLLHPDKCREAVESAHTTIGVPMIEMEESALKTLASETNRCRKLTNTTNRELERLTKRDKSMQTTSNTVGAVTAAVLVMALGPASNYDSAASYLKACGLNLKEKSSGKHKGQLRITKRGSSDARRYLYLAAMRLIQSDPVARAWYLKKVSRDGNRSRNNALVALMRKLLKALWHVGNGAIFDSSLLFDTSRLCLQ